MTLSYYKQLDGVRAIAALMVMGFHFLGMVHTDNAAFNMLAKFRVFGQTGVSLFFVLSGFLITRILLVTKESNRYFMDFYIRRALRIFPLYYLFLFIYYVIVPVIEQVPFVPFSQQVYFWFYLQNFALTFDWNAKGPVHYWSLAVEEHFYLIWPCLIYFLNRRGIKIAMAGIIIGAFVCRFIMAQQGYEVFYFTFTRMDELVIGAVLAILEAEGKLLGNAKKFIWLFIIVLIPTIILWGMTSGKAMTVIQATKYNLIGLTYFCLVGFVIAAGKDHFINKILCSRYFSFTGKISYGLYVYHPLCFGIIEAYFSDYPILLLFILTFGLAYLVASVSYFFFEAKFIALKKYFSYKEEQAKAYASTK